MYGASFSTSSDHGVRKTHPSSVSTIQNGLIDPPTPGDEDGIAVIDSTTTIEGWSRCSLLCKRLVPRVDLYWLALSRTFLPPIDNNQLSLYTDGLDLTILFWYILDILLLCSFNSFLTDLVVMIFCCLDCS